MMGIAMSKGIDAKKTKKSQSELFRITNTFLK